MREPNQAVLKIQTFNDLLTMYVGAPSQHALRTTFVPEAQALSFDTEIVACWSQLAGRDVTSPLFHLPHGWSWSGLCGTTTRCSAMDSLAIGHSHPNGTNRLSGHGLAVCTHPARSASPPPNHTRTPNEHTLPPPQTTGRSSPHTWHSKKHWSTPSNAPHINNSWTPTPTIPYRGPSSFPNSKKKHRCPPPTTQQRSPQSARQMLSGLTDPTTHANTSRCEPLNQQSHPRAHTSVQPNEFAPVQSMPISSTALFA